MKDVLVWALNCARNRTLAMVADVDEEQMCRQAEPGAHHAAWILGHLLLGDVYLLALLEVKALADDFPALLRNYGPGATPTGASERYHSKRVLTERLTDAYTARIAAVREITSDALRSPIPDPRLAVTQPTIVHHLHALVFHEGYHAGQLSSWRHAHGLPPVPWTLTPAGH